MAGVHQRTFWYTPRTAPSESGTLMLPSPAPYLGPPYTTRPFGIICLHGHGANSMQYAMSAYAFSPGSHARALCEAGFVVLSIDQGGPTPFANDVSMARFLDAYDYLVDTLGCHPQVGIMGWSMGGETALNIYPRYSQLLFGMWLWVPLADLRWAHSDVGYVPPDGSALANNATWTSEIDAAYNPSTTMTGYAIRSDGTVTGTVPAAGGSPVTLPVTNTAGFDDALLGPGRLTLGPTAGNTVTYTSKDRTNFYGVVTDTGSGNGYAGSGATVKQAYADMRGHYSAQAMPALFRGKGVDVCYALASDDATIPPSQLDTFLAAVNDPHHFLRPGGKVTGGHTGLFQNIGYQEVVAFYADRARASVELAASSSVDDMATRYASVDAMANSGLTVVTV